MCAPVRGANAVSAGEQIALEPALAQVLAQHLHDSSVSAQIDIHILDVGHPCLAGNGIDGIDSGCRHSPPLACGLAPMRRCPVGASAASSSRNLPSASNSSCAR